LLRLGSVIRYVVVHEPGHRADRRRPPKGGGHGPAAQGTQILRRVPTLAEGRGWGCLKLHRLALHVHVLAA